jgi:hypothetical protein
MAVWCTLGAWQDPEGDDGVVRVGLLPLLALDINGDPLSYTC